MTRLQASIRYRLFDSYRGFALILMALYHFCFDLNQFGVLHEKMNHDPLWLGFRAFIMTSFLGLVGVSFYFSNINYGTSDFRKRLFKIGVCAFLISVASFFINSKTWIYFGVLHLIFVATLLAPHLVRSPRISLSFGILLIVFPLLYRSAIFNKPGLVLLGLSPIRPDTEDFSPLMPWLGVIALGVTIGYWIRRQKPPWAQYEIPTLSKLGKNSLLFYMTHQLVLYPLAWLISIFI